MSDTVICAVVITFNPDPGFPDRLGRISSQVESILVIDNASGRRGQALLANLKPSNQLEIIRKPENLGIATALNNGMAWARARGYEWALAMDQDSEVAPDMVAKLAKVIQAPEQIEKIAIVAPQSIDSVSGKPSAFLRPRFGILYERTVCMGEVMEVTTAISSGSLVNLKIHEELGGFRDDYFMDYVDTEYCLRAQLHGYVVLAACRARLVHKLGERSEWRLGPFRLYPTNYPPSRWYTMSRNRIAIWRAYALRYPLWLGYEVVAMAFIIVRMLVAEGDRSAKLKSILKGTLDGIRGRPGRSTTTI